jgi:hypothetical protein
VAAKLNLRKQRRPTPASVPRLPRRHVHQAARCACEPYPCAHTLGAGDPAAWNCTPTCPTCRPFRSAIR